MRTALHNEAELWEWIGGEVSLARMRGLQRPVRPISNTAFKTTRERLRQGKDDAAGCPNERLEEKLGQIVCQCRDKLLG